MQIIRPTLDPLSQKLWGGGPAISVILRDRSLIWSTHSTEEKEMEPVTSFNSYTKLGTSVTRDSSQYT